MKWKICRCLRLRVVVVGMAEIAHTALVVGLGVVVGSKVCLELSKC